MEQIFILNGLTKSEIVDLIPVTWIKPTFDITVIDSNNERQSITMLYFNGVKEIYNITFEDGLVASFTPNHKLLTATGWRRVDELTLDDDIISY
jgi:intein/homing endonuclease